MKSSGALMNTLIACTQLSLSNCLKHVTTNTVQYMMSVSDVRSVCPFFLKKRKFTKSGQTYRFDCILGTTIKNCYDR